MAVYRKIGNRYQRVSDIFTFVIPGDQIDAANSNFVCTTKNVTPNVDVEVGDIIGACVYDPDSLPKRLEIVGRTNSDYFLKKRNTLYGCNINSVPSNIPRDQLSTATSRILHRY